MKTFCTLYIFSSQHLETLAELLITEVQVYYTIKYINEVETIASNDTKSPGVQGKTHECERCSELISAANV